ncbi:MAG: hypothetical protein EOM18_07380 [Clostridia bacterium]|nr:hypothetical protein [Clostridia bacterium]
MVNNISEAYLKLYMVKTCFAFPAEYLEEIVSDIIVAKIPSQNPWTFGVMYYKNEVIPVFSASGENGGIAAVCRYGNNDDKNRSQRTAYLLSKVGGFFTMTSSMHDTVRKDEGSNMDVIVLDDEQIFLPDTGVVAIKSD